MIFTELVPIRLPKLGCHADGQRIEVGTLALPPYFVTPIAGWDLHPLEKRRLFRGRTPKTVIVEFAASFRIDRLDGPGRRNVADTRG
jgi:hypothetical protein